MKYRQWRLILAISLLISSVLLYLFDYAVFKDPHEILTFMLGEIAFLPLEVLLVTLVIDRLLRYMERRNRLEKLNMVIGAFFVEMGTDLLASLSDTDPEIEGIRSNLQITSGWSIEEFSRVARDLAEYSFKVDISRVDLEHLHIILSQERGFFLRLIENPALMEHESFTDLLLAIFHLTEELARRPSFEDLPRSDLALPENRYRKDLRAAGSRMAGIYEIPEDELSLSLPPGAKDQSLRSDSFRCGYGKRRQGLRRQGIVKREISQESLLLILSLSPISSSAV